MPLPEFTQASSVPEYAASRATGLIKTTANTTINARQAMPARRMKVLFIQISPLLTEEVRNQKIVSRQCSKGRSLAKGTTAMSVYDTPIQPSRPDTRRPGTIVASLCPSFSVFRSAGGFQVGGCWESFGRTLSRAAIIGELIPHFNSVG